MDIKITEHFLYRYAQRIKNKSSLINLGDYQRFAKNNEEILDWEIEIEEIFKESEFIYQGTFREKSQTAKFHLNKSLGLVLVMSQDAKNLLTIYKVDFGFGEAINKITMNALYKELGKIEEKKEKYVVKHSGKLEYIEAGINGIDADIEALKSQINTLEMKKDGLINEMQVYKNEVEQFGLDKNAKCRQICYSIAYKNG